MMIDPTNDSTSDHPYRTAPAPRTFDPETTRVPYDGQTRMRSTLSSGLAHARIAIDPAARDLLAIESGDGPRPRIRLAAGELALTWRVSVVDWLRDVFAPGGNVVRGTPHYELSIRGGASDLAIEGR